MYKNDLIEKYKRLIKKYRFLKAENETKERNLIGGLTPKGEAIKNLLNAKIETLESVIIDIEKLEI